MFVQLQSCILLLGSPLFGIPINKDSLEHVTCLFYMNHEKRNWRIIQITSLFSAFLAMTDTECLHFVFMTAFF